METENKKNVLVKINFLKRSFDIVFSLTLIIVTFPLTLLILLGIFLEQVFVYGTISSLFYVEKRISQGKPFNLVKFNIFKPSLLKDLRDRKVFIHTKPLERDRNNLTHVGHFVQKTYMDEFPQFFSILNGSISLVGPRPVNLEVYQDLLDKNIYTKTVIKTGLTGNYQSMKGMVDKKSDVMMDQEYIDFCRNNSLYQIFLFDMKIILKTLKVLFQAKGL